MRNAPSVTAPVGRSRFGQCLTLCAWSSAVLLLLAWAVHVPAHPQRQLLVGGLLALWAVLAWREQRHAPCGLLHWDGASWWFAGGGNSQEVAPAVVLDLQRVLLLRIDAAAPAPADPRVRWCWMEAGPDRPQWLALRRALYSRARKDVPPSRGEEAAQP